MKRAHWLGLFLALGLLPLLGIRGGWLAQPVSAGRSPAVMQAPPLSPFINIWTTDTIDNLNPAVAYNSLHDEYLVVWWNDRGATRDIYARRVASDGTLLSWFSVVSTPNKWNWLPDVAYSPAQDEYLIVYAYNISSTDYDLWARRVNWNGSWMSAEFAINQDADKQWYPAVAYNSTNDEYLVIYENYWAGGLRDIAAQRVKASDGSLLSWRNIATAPGTVRRLPDVAYNAARNEYLIAYTYQSSPTADGDIYGKVASHHLGTLSSEIHLVDNTFDQDTVALAAGPNEYLAVWEDGPSPTHRTIYGRRVDGDGTLRPLIPIIDLSGQCVEPEVAYGAVFGYLVTWRWAGVPGLDHVNGRFVKPGQDSAWGDWFDIDSFAGSHRSPAQACAPSGDCLVVEEDKAGGDYEIRGRFVTPYRVYLPIVLKNY